MENSEASLTGLKSNKIDNSSKAQVESGLESKLDEPEKFSDSGPKSQETIKEIAERVKRTIDESRAGANRARETIGIPIPENPDPSVQTEMKILSELEQALKENDLKLESESQEDYSKKFEHNKASTASNEELAEEWDNRVAEKQRNSAEALSKKIEGHNEKILVLNKQLEKIQKTIDTIEENQTMATISGMHVSRALNDLNKNRESVQNEIDHYQQELIKLQPAPKVEKIDNKKEIASIKQPPKQEELKTSSKNKKEESNKLSDERQGDLMESFLEREYNITNKEKKSDRLTDEQQGELMESFLEREYGEHKEDESTIENQEKAPESSEIALEAFAQSKFISDAKNLVSVLMEGKNKGFLQIIHPKAINYLADTINSLEDGISKKKSSMEDVELIVLKFGAAIKAIGQDLPLEKGAIVSADSKRLADLVYSLAKFSQSCKSVMFNLNEKGDSNNKDLADYLKSLINLTNNRVSFVSEMKSPEEKR